MTAVPAVPANPSTPAVPADLTIRPLSGPDEVELFNRIPYVFNHEIADDLTAGRRRLPWLWVAVDGGGRLLARLAWWCRPQDDAPFLLDVFDFEEGHQETARLLLSTATEAVLPEGVVPPKYTRFLPADWREDPAVRPGIEQRIAVMRAAGAEVFVERLRLQWDPGTPVPAPTGQLSFRPVDGETELVELMTRVLDGTLDAYCRDDLTRMTPRQVAQEQYDDEMAHYTTPRSWWRVGTLPDGEPVGFVIAARNSYRPIIAYIGVLPGHRGHGWIDQLLAEGTRVLAAEEANSGDSVRASTDVGNVPMARSFERNGYRVFERELVMTWG
ncbi:GNAT family N-acetyltransferase [Streptacidiphilus carbonis]|uniref:GNAT family N-acetyltransferase n=1 Tax=Streptacidiphilus carbonis TaxID=105422 RepID=UPI0005AB8093|nr:GNAT family N-acetyltransferase [Streptacidiphilus carbonis]